MGKSWRKNVKEFTIGAGDLFNRDISTSDDPACHKSMTRTENIILTILSSTNIRIDQLQLSIAKYIYEQITEVCKEYNWRLEELRQSLEMLHHEVDPIEKRHHSDTYL